MTLLWYAPTKNKSAILLSTIYDPNTVDKALRKADIILNYNATKGGVDTVAQLCGTYAAQVIYYFNQNNNKIHRRIFLKDLAINLIKPHL